MCRQKLVQWAAAEAVRLGPSSACRMEMHEIILSYMEN